MRIVVLHKKWWSVLFNWTRFNNRIKETGVSKEHVGKKLGKDGAYIRDQYKRQKEFDKCQTEIIAKCLWTTPEYLTDLTDDPGIPAVSCMTHGESALLRQYKALDKHGRQVVDFIMQTEYERCVEDSVSDDGVAYIRHYLYSPAAGVNGLVSGEDYEDIPLPAKAPRGASYCLTVSGDSMEPYIKDGELIYVKEDEPLSDFDVGVFCVDGSTYVKQYCPSFDGSVYLLSANPKREDANITIKPDSASTLLCFGKVLLKKKLPKPIYP